MIGDDKCSVVLGTAPTTTNPLTVENRVVKGYEMGWSLGTWSLVSWNPKRWIGQQMGTRVEAEADWLAVGSQAGWLVG